jgi:hypothetical protein
MPTIEIYRVKIEPANAERLLEIRAAAVAEFQEQVSGGRVLKISDIAPPAQSSR